MLWSIQSLLFKFDLALIVEDEEALPIECTWFILVTRGKHVFVHGKSFRLNSAVLGF